MAEGMVKRPLQGVLVGGIAAAVALLLWATGFFDAWEFATWRWRVNHFAAPGAATDRIKIILLDQASLDWGEKENGWSWPWPREVYTAITDFCTRSGARAVAFDILFTESSLYGVDDDRALGAAIHRTPGFVASMFLGRQSGNENAWPPGLPGRSSVGISNLDEWLTPDRGQCVIMPKATFPVSEIAEGAGVLASVSQEPDFDGIFRRCLLFQVFDGRVVPSLGTGAFLCGMEGQAARISEGTLDVAGKRVPIDRSGRAILRFRGPVGSYETVSAAAVIQSELRMREGGKPVIERPDIFKDCYVFFGVSAPGLLDLRPTPISRVYPGVELHATMLDNLLSRDFLTEAPWWSVVLTIMLLSFFGAVLVTMGKSVRHCALTAAAFASIPIPAGFAAYSAGFWWPIVVHQAAVTLSIIGGVFLNYAYEGRTKAFYKKAFKHYLSPAVIDKLLEDPGRLKLGGERRELTIFFSDLQGFSSISERLDPEALTSLLNDYLTDMTDIILEEGGTLDKYEGDAIIAFWNAPTDQPDHAARACRASLRCQIKLRERRAELKERTGAELHMRIGINTGHVVVGNMGSRKRFDYTVLGDAANLASRLEGANKAFGTYTMVSDSTWEQAREEFLGREIGLLRVVGRKTPVRVYELIDPSTQGAPEMVQSFHAGLRLFYAGDWSNALDVFEGFPDDPLAKVYAARCRKLLESPENPWDGVWNLTEK